jgi:hypothetical protein
VRIVVVIKHVACIKRELVFCFLKFAEFLAAIPSAA